MSDNARSERFDLAQLIGVILCVAILDLVSRPIGYLLCPIAFLICIYVIAPSAFAHRWRRTCTMAAVISITGYLLTRYVFR
jgi:hypothetical protein